MRTSREGITASGKKRQSTKRLLKRLVKGIAIVLAILGAIVTVIGTAKLFMDAVSYLQNPPAPDTPDASIKRGVISSNIITWAIVAFVEAAFITLLSRTHVISRRLGNIATWIFAALTLLDLVLLSFIP